MKEDKILTAEESKFCLLYVNAPAPVSGDPRRCYQAAIDPSSEDAEASYLALQLMNEPHIKKHIEELVNLNAFDSASIKKKTTSTLLKIMDECAESSIVDRFGKEISPATMRSVSVNAAKELNSMYGIKEDIAHKVTLEGADGNGITFNINVPQPNKEVLDD